MNYLGFRTALSDIVWRFYKKQMQEKLALREIYEKRMKAIEVLVTKTFTRLVLQQPSC